MTSYRNVAELVRVARSDRSQAEFAMLLGIKQSTVSRYERGKASPPTRVIDRCMRLMHESATGSDLSAEALAERIRVGLASADLLDVRRALAGLLDAVLSDRSDGQNKVHVHH